MIKELEQLERERLLARSEQKKYNRLSIIFGTLAISFVLGIFFESAILIIIGIIGVFAAGIFATIGYKKTEPFRKKFKTEVITTLLKQKYNDVFYNPLSSIDLNEILSTSLVKRPDRWHGEDFLSATYKNVSFKVSEFKLEERHVRRDSKGNTYVTYETYFQGRWYVYTFPRNFKNSLRILEKSFLGFAFAPNGFKKVETESIEFNKKFIVHTTDEHHAFYIITPVMIERIAMLEKGFKGTISFLFRNNELHIAVNDSSNRFEPRLDIPLTDEGLKAYDIDINIMAEIIEAFGLDRDKFQDAGL
ncbi:MAG TPA: DUF3137 domain-containing protein [Acholeplasma sp.]|nr:DUF3137 domain-containing protein [Acholeplasma sp.]